MNQCEVLIRIFPTGQIAILGARGKLAYREYLAGRIFPTALLSLLPFWPGDGVYLWVGSVRLNEDERPAEWVRSELRTATEAEIASYFNEFMGG